MVNMAGQEKQYSNLSITIQHQSNDRSINEKNSFNSRSRRSKDQTRPFIYQPKTIYYNSNHRHQQQDYFTRPSHLSARRQQQSYHPNYNHIHYHHQHQPIRPLMEIKDSPFSFHQQQQSTNTNDDDDNQSLLSSITKLKQPKQRGQYRNRKAELDWDHAFDLDLIDLYPIQSDIDRYSLTSTLSSSDHSYSSM